MNIIFCAGLVISIFLLLFKNPSALMVAISSTCQSAVELTVSLFGIYAIWSGIFQIAVDCNVTQKLAKLINRPIRRLFGKTDEAESEIATNMVANLFGISAVATLSGIKAVETLDKKNNTYAQNMLFVLSSTSLQLIPFSVISLRALNGSVSPYDTIFPTLICTFISSLCGVLLVKIFIKNENR